MRGLNLLLILTGLLLIAGGLVMLSSVSLSDLDTTSSLLEAQSGRITLYWMTLLAGLFVTAVGLVRWIRARRMASNQKGLRARARKD
jgi:hypothetical protein